MTKIGQSALNSILTPGGILPRHAKYQIGDLLREAWSTRSVPGKGPLLRDELPVLDEQRIGCHQRPQFIKYAATQGLRLRGQPYPLRIGESKPLPLQLLLEHRVLLDKIVDDRLLVPTEPGGQGDYEKVERL